MNNREHVNNDEQVISFYNGSGYGRIQTETGDSQEYLPESEICSLCEPRSKIGCRAAELIQSIRQNRGGCSVPEVIAGELVTHKTAFFSMGPLDK